MFYSKSLESISYWYYFNISGAVIDKGRGGIWREFYGIVRRGRGFFVINLVFFIDKGCSLGVCFSYNFKELEKIIYMGFKCELKFYV